MPPYCGSGKGDKLLVSIDLQNLTLFHMGGGQELSLEQLNYIQKSSLSIQCLAPALIPLRRVNTLILDRKRIYDAKDPKSLC